VYDYPNLANSKTATASYTTSFSIASGISKGVVIGFTGFEIPSTTDFSIATSKTIGASSFVLDVVLYNNTVVYKLKVEYMVIVYTSSIFHKYTVSTYSDIKTTTQLAISPQGLAIDQKTTLCIKISQLRHSTPPPTLAAFLSSKVSAF